jgi:hypothetical protein
MNLYRVWMTHAAPKDNQSAIQEYLIAEDDKSVFNYLKSPESYTYWNDVEKDQDEYDEDTLTIDYIFKNHGDSSLDSKWEDLYYGSTMYDWEIFKENLEQSEIDVLVKLEIAKTV